MSLDIHDPETERLVLVLAERDGISPNEAIKRAVGDALKRTDGLPSLWERIRPIQDRALSRAATGLVADKAFYDALNGNP
ncbi:type II toxin-antitoxin system VapB family antitoxin [Methylobacterium gossipiicola]|uniref:Antitoxin VapB n=1 Tax=Methylobacterium gossipiicola TaxID=582675 RepID=A0A1I2RPT4_9HYPH|nr:type II toxin-antitoxin system VapB family antitoxin [Methylobacterium gossipiicola]SFG42518.1 antitoxin VapB [Methylobacterium gossipiicola]